MIVPPDKYHDTEFSDPMLALDFAGVVSFIMWIFNFIILLKYIS